MTAKNLPGKIALEFLQGEDYATAAFELAVANTVSNTHLMTSGWSVYDHFISVKSFFFSSHFPQVFHSIGCHLCLLLNESLSFQFGNSSCFAWFWEKNISEFDFRNRPFLNRLQFVQKHLLNLLKEIGKSLPTSTMEIRSMAMVFSEAILRHVVRIVCEEEPLLIPCKDNIIACSDLRDSFPLLHCTETVQYIQFCSCEFGVECHSLEDLFEEEFISFDGLELVAFPLAEINCKKIHVRHK